MGVLHLEKVAQENLSPTLAALTSPWAQEGPHVSLSSLTGAVTAPGIALHCPLVDRGGACAVPTTSCSTWIASVGHVERAVQK